MSISKKIIILLVLSALLVLTAWLWAGATLDLNERDDWDLVYVEKGSSIFELATQLHKKQLLTWWAKQGFVAAGLVSGRARKLQPGQYKLKTTMTAWEMLGDIATGKVHTVRITIPEGFTLEQIGELLEEEKLATKGEFLELTTTEAASFGTRFPKVNWSLEGYLFPDTYETNGDGRSVQLIIGKMLNRFDEVVWEELFKENENAAQLSLHEVITLASLIEREAQVPEERPLIAGVYMNRLRKGMKLGCDATVQYAMDNHKSRLTFDDLKTPSLYNTYLYKGLPPGPICNPGRASIAAALNPEKSDYLFYVAKGDGSHIFSRSYQEHQRTIDRLRN